MQTASEIALVLAQIAAVFVSMLAAFVGLGFVFQKLFPRTLPWAAGFRAFAAQHALESDGSALRGSYRGASIDVTVDEGLRRPTYTVVTIMIGALPPGIWVRQRSRMASLGRLLDAERFETGDAELARTFVVGASHPALARAFLARPQVRSALLDLASRHDIALEGGALRVYRTGPVPREPREIEDAVEGALVAARLLEREATGRPET